MFLPQIGIFIVYFLDNILGSAWWVMVLYMIQLFAVLVVRGKPYGAEQIVTVIFPRKACCSSMLGPLLAFTWNVVSGVREFLNFDVIAMTSFRRRRLINSPCFVISGTSKPPVSEDL